VLSASKRAVLAPTGSGEGLAGIGVHLATLTMVQHATGAFSLGISRVIIGQVGEPTSIL
jgi:hypothetical protein